MRQISRLVAKARNPVFQQQTMARIIEYVKSLSYRNGLRRNSHLQIVERQQIQLRTKLLHHITALQNQCAERQAIVTQLQGASGKGLIDKKIKSNKSEENENFTNISKVPFNRNENIYDLFSSRKQNIRDSIYKRKELLNVILQTSRGTFNDNLLHRKKIFKETLLARRNNLRDTEKKVLDHGKALLKDLKEAKQVVKVKMEEVIEKENIYTIPNFLCVTRIAFSPYLAYLIVTENFEYALTFMAVASISDWLDGWIARNYKSQSTKIGSFLDPMADKVLIGTLFLTLTYVGLIPVPLTVLIVGRDVALVGAGFVIRYNSLSPPRTFARYFNASHVTAQLTPTLISKVNTAIQLALVASTLAAPVLGFVGHPALNGLCYITGLSTVLAAASYLISKDTYKYIQRK